VRIEPAEVAVVGGGLAGSALAARLADRGHEVVLIERLASWHWRAAGVFASPAALAMLREGGLDPATIEAVARPIPAMRVETGQGTAFRLTYGTEAGGEPAVGFDRSRLDPAVLDLAERAGADVRRGWTATEVDLTSGRLVLRGPDGEAAEVLARVIVGADGPRSIVARAAGVARPSRLGPRLGLTWHQPVPAPDLPRDARMCLIRDGYVGVAPVPGGRVNIGIVLGRSWHGQVARRGGRLVADAIVAAIPSNEDEPAGWRSGRPLDPLVGAWPLGHRVTRRAGPGWLLVGDAAGFLDPFTGEGIHRALVSAELAATAIHAQGRGRPAALEGYERAMHRRFLAKDVVSTIVQGFLARPAAFEYAARRIARRPALRSTLGLVMGDLTAASRAVDPRYLAALLAP
jgi:flavin-dependent dehydrogenase